MTKDGKRRAKAYDDKIDPESFAYRTRSLSEKMKSRYAAAAATAGMLDMQVRSILDAHGISIDFRNMYFAFKNRVTRLSNRYPLNTLTNQCRLERDKFISHGADSSILDEILSLFSVDVTIPDFGLTLDPNYISMSASETRHSTATLSKIGKFKETVALTAENVPAHMSVTFDPTSGIPTFTSDITIITDSWISGGDYEVTIKGTSPSQEHTAILTVHIG